MQLHKEKVYKYEAEAVESDVVMLKHILKRGGIGQNQDLLTELLKFVEQKANEAIELYIKHRKSLKNES